MEQVAEQGWYVRRLVGTSEVFYGLESWLPACICGWEGPKLPIQRWAAEEALAHVKAHQ